MSQSNEQESGSNPIFISLLLSAILLCLRAHRQQVNQNKMSLTNLAVASCRETDPTKPIYLATPIHLRNSHDADDPLLPYGTFAGLDPEMKVKLRFIVDNLSASQATSVKSVDGLLPFPSVIPKDPPPSNQAVA